VLSSEAADLLSLAIDFGSISARLIISVLSLSSGAGASPITRITVLGFAMPWMALSIFSRRFKIAD